jgi:hypothetical protein
MGLGLGLEIGLAVGLELALAVVLGLEDADGVGDAACSETALSRFVPRVSTPATARVPAMPLIRCRPRP